MHLTKHQWMRETMSDISNIELYKLWNAINEGDLVEIGIMTTRIFQPAIDAYEDQESERRESEADEERRLFNAGEARALRGRL